MPRSAAVGVRISIASWRRLRTPDPSVLRRRPSIVPSQFRKETADRGPWHIDALRRVRRNGRRASLLPGYGAVGAGRLQEGQPMSFDQEFGSVAVALPGSVSWDSGGRGLLITCS